MKAEQSRELRHGLNWREGASPSLSAAVLLQIIVNGAVPVLPHDKFTSKIRELSHSSLYCSISHST